MLSSDKDDTMMILDLEVGGSKLACRVVSLDKGLYSTLPLFTQVYKWVPATPFLSASMSFTRYGHHTGAAYSRIGRTKVIYKIKMLLDF